MIYRGWLFLLSLSAYTSQKKSVFGEYGESTLPLQ